MVTILVGDVNGKKRDSCFQVEWQRSEEKLGMKGGRIIDGSKSRGKIAVEATQVTGIAADALPQMA